MHSSSKMKQCPSHLTQTWGASMMTDVCLPKTWCSFVPCLSETRENFVTPKICIGKICWISRFVQQPVRRAYQRYTLLFPTDRQTERDRQRDRHANRQTDRQTERNRQTRKQTDRERQTERQTRKQTDRERQTDRHANRQTERHTQSDTQTDRQTERNRQTRKQTDRETDRMSEWRRERLTDMVDVYSKTSEKEGSVHAAQRDQTSHAGTVVPECFKDDNASQWKSGKFDHSSLRNPWTDRHQNLHGWLGRGPLPLCKILSRYDYPPLLPKYAKMRIKWLG